jgi:hypothetical protein
MTECTVHFTDTLSVSVVIDTDETDPEAIAEAAYEELPRDGRGTSRTRRRSLS